MDQFEFGMARRSLTPRVPVSLAGYFTPRPWTHVLDDLVVQALALRGAAGTVVVLVQLDLISAPYEFITAVRAACAGQAGLAPQNLLFTATHTHTAPEPRATRPGGNPAWNQAAIAAIVAAVEGALADLRPGGVATACAHEGRLAFNRRYWMADGTVVTNPPRRDPRIRAAEGPIDPDIPLLALCRDDRPAVLLASIANHADTIAGTGVSADWHGFLRRQVEAAHPGLQVISFCGCAGNLNHFDPHGPDEQSGYETARRLGEGYAAAILEALPRLQASADARLAAVAGLVTTGPREIDPAELAEAREHAARYTFDTSRPLTSEDLANRSPAALKYFADALIALAADRRERQFEVHAVRLGPAILVTLPGEPFTEHGLHIRHDLLPGVHSLVASLGDGRAGYVPNRCNYGRGGYETTPRSSPYSIDTGVHLRRAVASLLAQL